MLLSSDGSRISQRGCANCKGGGTKNKLFLPIFPKNCMKLNNFGPRGGGGAHPWHPPGSANVENDMVLSMYRENYMTARLDRRLETLDTDDAFFTLLVRASKVNILPSPEEGGRVHEHKGSEEYERCKVQGCEGSSKLVFGPSPLSAKGSNKFD